MLAADKSDLPHGGATHAPQVASNDGRHPRAAGHGRQKASDVAGIFTDYESTFRFMVYRRLQRELLGTFSKQRKWVTRLWVFAFIALEVGLISITNSQGFMEFELRINVLTNLVGTLLLVVLLYVVLQVVTVLRWCILWIAVGSIITLIIEPSERIKMRPMTDATRGGVASVIGGITASMCILNILLWYHFNKIYPVAVRDGRSSRWPWLDLKDVQRYFQIKPIAERSGFYTYHMRTLWLPCWSKECTFGYVGEVDEKGRPHGLGTWQDDAKHGECLQGVWEHGRPVGPFRASEYHSDYRFANVRVGFAHNRAEDANDERWWRPTFSETGLTWGVASLEQVIALLMALMTSDCER